ncbi:MAG: hypothetical protein QXW51_01255 [Sulfolobaceae archaeon]
MGRKLIITLMLLLTIFSSLTLVQGSNTGTINVYYSRYESIYRSHNVGIINQVTYIVSSAVYNKTITDNTHSFKITYNRTVYTLTFYSPKQIQGYINVTAYSNNTIKVLTNISNLIRVIVNSAGESELVWAGLNQTNILTYAYINGSGNVILEFANGTSIVNETLNIKLGSTTSEKATLTLLTFTVSSKSSTSGEITTTTQVPRRYSPLFMSTYYNGTEINSTAKGYLVSKAYFNGTLTPALIWKGEGLVPNMIGMSRGSIEASFETIEFYGVNGTVLGYVHISALNGTTSIRLGGIQSNTNIEFTELKIVTINGIKPVHAEFTGYVYVNGQPVIIEANSEGNVSSTAIVNISHIVSVNKEEAVLVEISINNTAKFIVLTKSNTTANVTIVKPINVSITTKSINGSIYKAQKVVVNVSSNNKYILFNVSIIANGTIEVYKEINGTLVKLNSSNYFILNGKLEVFDDPSTTYYIIYPTTAVVNTTTTTTTQSSTTTTTTTQSSTTPSTTTSTATTTTQTIITSSSSSTQSNLLYIAIGIIAVIIIVGIILAIRRR